MPLLALAYRFLRVIWAMLKDPETRAVVLVVIMLLIGGTAFYHVQEGWGWLDSLYFSVITLTTVGYGDFSPKTDAGKLFTILYIFVGLGILATFITLVAQKRELGSLLPRRRQRGSSADTSITDDPIPHDPPEV